MLKNRNLNIGWWFKEKYFLSFKSRFDCEGWPHWYFISHVCKFIFQTSRRMNIFLNSSSLLVVRVTLNNENFVFPYFCTPFWGTLLWKNGTFGKTTPCSYTRSCKRYKNLWKLRWVLSTYFWFCNIAFFWISNYFSATVPSYMTSSNRFNTSEVVGGQDAPSPVPWQVSVRSWSSHFCGATILDESTLLCAAHCFPGSSSTSGKTIRAGSTERSSGGQVFILLIYFIDKDYDYWD